MGPLARGPICAFSLSSPHAGRRSVGTAQNRHSQLQWPRVLLFGGATTSRPICRQAEPKHNCWHRLRDYSYASRHKPAAHGITDLPHASTGAHGGQGKTARTGDAARGEQKQVVNPTKKKQSCTTFTHPSLTAPDSATHGEPTRHAMKYRRGRAHQACSVGHTPATSLQRFKDLLGSACVHTLPEVQVLSGAVGLLITRCRNALDTSLIICPSLRAAGLARFLDRRLGINGIVIHCRDRLWSALR